MCVGSSIVRQDNFIVNVLTTENFILWRQNQFNGPLSQSVIQRFKSLTPRTPANQPPTPLHPATVQGSFPKTLSLTLCVLYSFRKDSKLGTPLQASRVNPTQAYGLVNSLYIRDELCSQIPYLSLRHKTIVIIWPVLDTNVQIPSQLPSVSLPPPTHSQDHCQTNFWKFIQVFWEQELARRRVPHSRHITHTT